MVATKTEMGAIRNMTWLAGSALLVSEATGCDVEELPEVPPDVADPDPDDEPDDDEGSAIEIGMELAPPPEGAVPSAGRTSPKWLWMNIRRIAFSADAEGCTDPVTVFEDTSGLTELGVGQSGWEDPIPGTAPPGTYQCVIVTLEDFYGWRGVEGPCPDLYTTDLYPTPGEDPDISTFYLTTADLRVASQNLDGLPVYQLESAFEQTGDTHTGALIVHAFDHIDATTCTFVDPMTFGYVHY